MKITIQAGINTYRVAGKTLPVDGDGIYQGRLLNEISLTRTLSRVGSTPVSINISLRNNDAFILSTVELWGAVVTAVSDSGYQWQGKITAYDSDSAGIMYLVVTEKSAPELLVKFPDEVARLVTLDENFHVSAINVTLPMVIGGNLTNPVLVKGILIDKTAGIYLFCVGEIHQIVKVYRGTEELSSGFSSFTGTAGQANYPGFVYVQLTDEDLRKNDDGTYVEISAEVIGLKLGSHTVEECRNGARFLLWLLKTAREGVGGWGLGIAEADIDLDASNTAIARVDTAGLKMDGVFYFRQVAQSWIDQICQAIRGSYEIGENGKRRLFVNAVAASVKTYTKKNIKLLRYGKGAYTGQVFNKGQLEFGYNPLTSQFMQTLEFEDAPSIADIDEQKFSGQSYLIRDMTTARAILDYTCQESLIGARRVYFETKELPTNCRTGDVITIDYPEKGLTGEWQIKILEIGDRKHRIDAKKFSDTIFASGTPGTAIDWSQDQPIVSPFLPGSPSGLNLSTVIDYDSAGDGAARPFIEGTFTPPEGKYLGAAVFWGEGAEPATWNSHGSIRGTTFRVGPVKAGQQYTIKIQLFNSSGASTAITGSIVAGSHTELPPVPTVTASGGLGCIVVSLSVASFGALDGFEIQRQKSNGTGLITITSTYRGTSFTDDSPTILEAYADAFQYRARSISRSKLESAWSAWATATSAIQAQSKDITANQIIAKDFRTACNVGSTQNGVMFNAAGLQAWCGGVKTVDIPVSGSPAFSGTITAGAGNIGGWIISSSGIKKDGATAAQHLWLSTSGCPTIIVSAYSSSAATYHTFGGCLYNGAWLNDRWGIVLRAGGNNLFQVHSCIDGVTCFCAQIAGWNFNASCLYSNNILLNSAGSIQTCNFVTGNCGWKIDSIGNAEFNNICARGAIRTVVFIKDQISVVGGCTMIRPASILSQNDAMWCGGNYNYVDDETQFAINDIVRIKDGINDYWGLVTGCIAGRLTLLWLNGSCSGEVVTKGQAIVNYGSCVGCGGIVLNGQCPYIDLYTHSGSPWNGTDSRVRIGNLNGWGTFSTNTYGFAAGSPIGQYLTYDSASSVLNIKGSIIVGSTGIGNFTDAGALATKSIVCNSDILTGNTGAAMNDDPNFQDSTAWVDDLGTATIATISDGVTGNKAMRSTPGLNTWPAVARLMPTVSGKQYRFTALVRLVNPSSPTTTSSFYIGGYREYDAAETLGATAWGTSTALSNNSGWTRISAIASPAAKFIRPFVGLNQSAVAGAYGEMQDFRIEEVLPGSLVQGMDNNSNLITSVIPGSAVNPSGAGLFLGCNYLGFYNGGWKTYMDNGGNFALVGAGTHGLSWNATTGVLTIAGSITVVGGSGYGNFTDKPTSLCGINSTEGSKLTGIAAGADVTGANTAYDTARVNNVAAATVQSGAAKANSALDSSNRLITAVIPATTVAPSTAGLYMGSNYLGYYNGGWKTYMDNTGNFYLNGATGGLAWNGSILTICGTVCSCCGNIGGWEVSAAMLRKYGGTANQYLMLCSGVGTSCPHIIVSGCSATAATYHTFGGRVFNGAWLEDRWGLVLRAGGNNLFQAHSCSDGTNLCATIAGWNFNHACLYSGNLILNSAGAIQGNYTAGSAGWCISSTGAAEFNSVTVRGCIYSCCGKIGLWNLCSTGLCYAWSLGGTCGTSNVLMSGFYFHQTTLTEGGKAYLNVWQCCTRFDAAAAILCIDTYSTSQYGFYTNGRISVNCVACTSDRNLKTDFTTVSVLSAIRQTPITKWRFKDSKDYSIGMMAQDFHCVFKLAHDWETNVTVSGLDGIALRGVQELDECVAYNNRRILELESRNACLETRLNCLATEFLQLKTAA